MRRSLILQSPLQEVNIFDFIAIKEKAFIFILFSVVNSPVVLSNNSS